MRVYEYVFPKRVLLGISVNRRGNPHLPRRREHEQRCAWLRLVSSFRPQGSPCRGSRMKEASMAIRETTYIAQNIHPLWTNREYDRILSEMIAEDVEWTTVPTGETFRGHEGFRQFMEGWSDAFPDGRAEDTNVYVGEDFAVTEFVGRGTHTGTLRTPAGEIPPTERTAEWPLCEVYQIRDGKIVRGRTYFDVATLMDELGFTLSLEQQSRAEEEAPPRAAEVPPKTA